MKFSLHSSCLENPHSLPSQIYFFSSFSSSNTITIIVNSSHKNSHIPFAMVTYSDEEDDMGSRSE